MSDNQPNHELNDELLSAYLDGELSETERASVETRLASDPEAQHLLHQLRAVSQEVQALPLKSAGRDLHEQILQRVEKEKPAEKVSLLPGDTMPRITVFQTRRSWIWASLVVAAGLMIMVMQSGDKKGNDLSAVARRDNSGAAKDTRVESVDRALSEPASGRAIEPAQVAQMDSASGSSGGAAPMAANAPVEVETATADQLASADRSAGKTELPASAPASSEHIGQPHDSQAESAFRGGPTAGPGSPMPATGSRAGESSISSNGSSSPALASRTSSFGVNGELKDAAGTAAPAAPEKLAASRPASPGLVGRAGGGGRGPADGQPTEAGVEPSSLIHVVHVVAKPDAIQNKAFDQLLARNGIEVASQPPAGGQIGGKFDRVAQQAEVRRPVGKLKESASEEERDVELVLVEAPQSAIMSFMAGLNKDSDNYVGVEVDDAPEQNGATNKESLAKKATTELSQYSRGIVTAQQKDAFRNRSFTSTDINGDRAKLGAELKRESTDERQPQPTDSEVAPEKQKQVETIGRARRVESWEVTADQRGQDKSFGGAMGPGGPGGMKLRRAESAEKATDAENANWQVLFVLSPDRDSANSAPAAKPTK